MINCNDLSLDVPYPNSFPANEVVSFLVISYGQTTLKMLAKLKPV